MRPVGWPALSVVRKSLTLPTWSQKFPLRFQGLVVQHLGVIIADPTIRSLLLGVVLFNGSAEEILVSGVNILLDEGHVIDGPSRVNMVMIFVP